MRAKEPGYCLPCGDGLFPTPLIEETPPAPLCVLKGLVEQQPMEEHGVQDWVVGRSFSLGTDPHR